VADLEVVLQTVAAKVEGILDQLHARHREAIRADQLAAVGQLASGLAHEFRNPLMCMRTLVQSAKRQGDPAHLDSRDLSVLDEEITRLNDMLQTFLDFARPAKPDAEDVDTVHIIRQTCNLLSRKAEARDVRIECRMKDEPLVVHADATQFRQVLLNLLLNALDAVPNGGRIWVDAIRLRGDRSPAESGAKEGSEVCVRVTDDGQGLPADERARIFEPFFSTKDTGLGLGLAISKRIIDAHGGRLVCSDRQEGGAIFEVHLPVRSAPSTACTSLPPRLPHATSREN
jgi:signal transduction histidine kinase